MAYTVDKESRLTTLIAQGSESAFRELYDNYYTQLSVYANKILDDLDVSLDIVQGIFVDLYSEREKLTSVGSIRSYLYQSVHNRCLNELKHQKVVQRHQKETLQEKGVKMESAGATISDNDESAASDMTLDFTPEELMEYAELQNKVEEAIAALPAQCQRIFRMSRMEEKTNDEIAAELGISKRTVETQISQALKQLRENQLPLLIVLTILQQQM
ncbi:MAG: RNA polymerase sigma-70 factor [Bacteroidales bacterium]|nr:RNA polymerase sigma-70 factor [Bacteroidales bacterium]